MPERSTVWPHPNRCESRINYSHLIIFLMFRLVQYSFWHSTIFTASKFSHWLFIFYKFEYTLAVIWFNGSEQRCTRIKSYLKDNMNQKWTPSHSTAVVYLVWLHIWNGLGPIPIADLWGFSSVILGKYRAGIFNLDLRQLLPHSLPYPIPAWAIDRYLKSINKIQNSSRGWV